MEILTMHVKSPPRSSVSPFIWLPGILVLFFLIRLLLFVGIVGADDVSIASQSLKVLSDGFYLPTGHYAARVGLIYPQALIFALFGVGEWQMALLPMLSSLGGILLAFAIGRRYGGDHVGLLAAFVLTIFPLDAYLATTLMPDQPLGVMIGLTFYLLVLAEEKQRSWLAVAAGLAWGWAYLIKVEAFFFLFVVLTMWALRQLSFRTVLACAAAVGAIVLAEHVIYFIASGDPLLRLHLATVQGGGEVVEEYSAAQLWVFPKAWFLTPYYFGLHYYMLFLAIAWLPLRGHRALLPIVVWVVVYLLWLQFGGNPFAEHYSAKSHLDRYCSMISIPMAVLIAALLRDMGKIWGSKFEYIGTGLLFAVALLFIPFNQLGAERQVATKRLLDIARAEQLFPLYLDRTSLALADFYLYDEAKAGKLHTLQEHDFRHMTTKLTPIDEVNGYVLINHGFVDYSYNRYRVSRVSPELFKGKFEEYKVADNPLSPMSYASARVLRWFAGFIPLERFRLKIQHTADELLSGRDAVLMRPSSQANAQR